MRDHASTYTFCAVMASQSEVPNKIMEWVLHLKNACKKTLTYLHCNNAAEYIGNLKERLAKVGTTLATVSPYHPQQNGKAERCNRMVGNMARTMLHAARLPIIYWSYAYLTAAYIHNRLPNKCVSTSPLEALYKIPASPNTLYPFGARAIVTLPQGNWDKLDERGVEFYLLGYPKAGAGWMFYSSKLKQMIQNNLAIFPNLQELKVKRKLRKNDVGFIVNQIKLVLGGGLDSGTPKGRVQTPARPPPHAARCPHAYKWREDGRLGVRPRRTGVLAMHACPEGVQALHALRTGVHGRHACPARLTVLNGTLIRVLNGTLIRAPRGSRKPLNLRGLREPGWTGMPAVHACPEGVQGLHACPAGPHAKPAVLTPFVGVRHAGVCTPVWEGVQPPHAFFLGVRGGVRTPFGRAAIKPHWGEPTADLAAEELKAIAGLPSGPEHNLPKNIKQVLAGPDGTGWKDAARYKLNKFQALEVWEPVNPYKGVKVLGACWVFTIKRLPNGSIDRLRARYVAKGFNQTLGVDCNKTYAPTASLNTLRLLISVARQHHYPKASFDISLTYLYSPIEEEVYVQPPVELKAHWKGKIMKLKKAMYGT
ncbi:hypothetical protein PCANC_21685 [Puccinia coronata f. sp. avenae]|uniref:Integrase catalytic domain-containing protein n=1 Tax=Puccinia coronata f. sp. avenae TaxID=200324 RepID=A0A2N5UJ90_9BASI|nr:hypothetical protein PCANC_21685 [Puccinia coronata f. sp. avenae]